MIKLHNGVLMPKIGLGTFLIENGELVEETVLKALEIGYRHIDTAQRYFNEEGIGKAIKQSKIKRSDLFITTKLKHHGPSHDIYQAIDASLKRLQTEYIDLLLIHWPNPSYEVNLNTWRVFEELYKQKKVRAIGVSNFQIHHLEALIKEAKVVPMVNQVEMHPGLNQIPLKAYLDSKKIVLESYGPFMKGQVFTANYAETLQKIADKYQKTIAQVVIAWGLNRGIIMIPKSVNEVRIKENFEAKDLVLTQEEIEQINQLNRGSRVYTDPDNSPWGPYKDFTEF